MSRIGKLPIPIPDKAQVHLDGRSLSVKGPKGDLDWEICDGVEVEVAGGQVVVKRPDDSRC